jgi:hypothetical protein
MSAFVRVLLGAGWAAVFLPGEPARLGRLPLWKPTGAAAGDRTAPTGLETEAVELVLPHGRSVRRRRVEGCSLPVAVAVSALVDAEPTHPSGAAWQAATRFALRLLADGRLHPALTPAGYDTCQVGPFTAAQRQTLDALAAAFPPHAHCLPEPGPAPVRIAEPAALISQFCDAVADDLVRTPAAPLAMGALPYAWREARAVPTLREWAGETQAALTAEVSVSLRVDVPDGRRRSSGPFCTCTPRRIRRSSSRPRGCGASRPSACGGFLPRSEPQTDPQPGRGGPDDAPARRYGPDLTSVVAFTAGTRGRDGAAVRPQASMTGRGPDTERSGQNMPPAGALRTRDGGAPSAYAGRVRRARGVPIPSAVASGRADQSRPEASKGVETGCLHLEQGRRANPGHII